jgi:short-subunit dehydrogenase
MITLPHMGAYNASKAAVVALSETLHAELAPHDVSVSVLCPSFTRTRLIDASSGNPKPGKLDVGRKLMDKLGSEADEVARAALRAVHKKRLYVVPPYHGRFVWSLKRLSPELFNRVLGIVASKV